MSQSRKPTQARPPVALVGMGLALPNASSPVELWDLLHTTRATVSEPTPLRMNLDHFLSSTPADDKLGERVASFLNAFTPHPRLIDDVRSGRWSPASSAPASWLRHCAFQALDGVYVGTGDRSLAAIALSADTVQDFERDSIAIGMRERMAEAVEKQGSPAAERAIWTLGEELDRRYAQADRTGIGRTPDALCRQALSGVIPHIDELAVVTATCASGLATVNLAVRQLRDGVCDVALCAALHELTPRLMVTLRQAGVLSPSHQVRPFDQNADGTVFGDGAVVLVLKTLERAQQDRDTVLAVVAGYGEASDGRGKSISAPNPLGQRRAVERAWRTAGISGSDLGLLIAHGTGTRTGDPVELGALEMALDGGAWPPIVTNKAWTGHTGTTSGLVSVVHAALALRQEEIPAQRFFGGLADDLELDTRPEVPTGDTPWPAGADPRLVGISSFGMGGANAHLVLTDSTTPAEDSDPAPTEDVVLVGWSSAFPGDFGHQSATDWIAHGGKPPAPRFGDDFPMPDFRELRIPPSILDTMDRTEIMALRMVRDLMNRLGTDGEDLRERTGVLIAHVGHTQAAANHMLRCYVDDSAQAFTHRDDDADVTAAIRDAHASVAETLRTTVAPASSDTIGTSVIASLIAGWTTNYFDLHGPHLAVETGVDAGLSALHVAEQYLRHNDADLLFVAGLNAHSGLRMDHSTGTAKAGRRAADGGITVALARRSVAERENLPVLATLSAGPSSRSPVSATPAWQTAPLAGSELTYLGADGLLACLNAALTASTPAHIAPQFSSGPYATISPSGDEPDAADTDSDEQETAPGRPRPEGSSAVLHCDSVIVSRQHPQWTEVPVLDQGAAARTQQPIPPDTLIVTDIPQTVIELDLPDSARIWSTTDLTGNHPHLHVVDPADLDAARAALPAGIRHLRVITTLTDLDPASEADRLERVLTLHDLTFGALQTLNDMLTAGATAAALLLNAVRHDIPHPAAHLFNGLLKTLAVEAPAASAWTVATHSQNLPEALTQLNEEAQADHPLGITVRAPHGRRFCYALQPLDPEPPHTPASAAVDDTLGTDSVVVVCGGATGITGEIMTAVARHCSPTIYLLGRTPAPAGGSADLLVAPPDKPTFLAQQRAERPGATMAGLLRDHSRLSKQYDIALQLAGLRDHSGSDRVHYLACDLTDAASVNDTIATIQRRHGGIDLLIHAASAARPGSLANKRLTDFRRGRDTKVRGYLNLRAATADNPPRLWCNFGSFIGFAGWPGEADYASANDFLSGAARWSRAIEDRSEYTINWTAWAEVGIAADNDVRTAMQQLGIDEFMTPDEGVLWFFRALQDGSRPPVIVHLPASEMRWLLREAPTLSSTRADANVPATPATPVTATRTFALDRDRDLAHHMIRGRPLAPSTVVMDMAFRAAREAIPDLRPTGLRDLELDEPVIVLPHRTKILNSTITRVQRDHDQATLHFEVTSDLTHPATGRPLRRQTHGTGTVVMSADPPPPPAWQPPDPAPQQPVPNPIHTPNPVSYVSGPFVCTSDHRSDTHGASSTINAPQPQWKDSFASYTVPVRLLQGLLEMTYLARATASDIPLLLLQHIQHIDFYTDAGEDALLESNATGLRVFATPGGDTITVVSETGTVLAQVRGAGGTHIGDFSRDTTAITEHHGHRADTSSSAKAAP
ncbi:SDR family NAD(P)-dependent oxidoreductase [Streptomyces sp. LP05-1]|uniref:SDR family NAD(P)-dependent oxidoreductase n=1 Tax=Streptomyces pyxinae TaxID=2970734 RepID=A0ABT2CBH4_9ACTN|nr:SDR family NAD(P)-dependent oxidoreductase [Streptomyces sp. LP05-1]MCS0634739.1 SDR family NAD(P)-dependent oxidoreductase [Streptomyces sp. LP05-1]